MGVFGGRTWSFFGARGTCSLLMPSTGIPGHKKTQYLLSISDLFENYFRALFILVMIFKTYDVQQSKMLSIGYFS
jgi:hypothetical protein